MAKPTWTYTDQIIFGHDVTDLMRRFSGMRWLDALRELERMEPVLGAYIENAAQTLAMSLAAYGSSTEAIRTTEDFVRHAMLVVAASVRRGHQRLYEDFLPLEAANGGKR